MSDAPPTVLVLQHVGAEGPGRISDGIEAAGLAIRTLRIDEGAAVPARLDGYAGLVVMGGPMSAYESDRYAHLRDERALLDDAIGKGAPLLGVCLGSQLLAAALGARVYASAGKEIGWYDVDLTDAGRSDAAFADAPARFRPLHWHGDVFDLPHGAVSLARSKATEHQAFRAGAALGLLFHLEVTADGVRAMADAFPEELAACGIDRSALVAESGPAAVAVEAVAAGVFGRWARAIAAPKAQRTERDS